MQSKFVVRPSDVPSYSPANHEGTKNYRLVAPGVNGAQFMEIIYGDIERHAGAVAHAHPGILIIGLLLSVAMMGLAANYIARVINKYRWIAYIGLAVILVVAVKMIYEGWVGTGDTLGIITLLR